MNEFLTAALPWIGLGVALAVALTLMNGKKQ